jgi:maltose O-acetyltransferase
MDALVVGPVEIGADVMMGPRCVLLATSHDFSSVDVPMNQQGFSEPRPIVIEDDVWIGAGATILPGVRIGRGSIIGAGAVVPRDVPAWSVAVGNPARVVRDRRATAGALPVEILADQERAAAKVSR